MNSPTLTNTSIKSARLFINPAAGRRQGKKLATKICTCLSKHGLNLEAHFTKSKGDMLELIQEAILEGVQTLIVVGGDGSIYEAVNGIMLSSETADISNVSLAIIPLGTGNDFIKATNIPRNWRKACEYLANAKPRRIDIAKITTTKKSAYFINNIGSGFDAGIGITASKIPVLRGKIVYVIGLLWHLIKGFTNPSIELTIDGKKQNTQTSLVAVSNGTTYGGSFKIAPKANINDGFLDTIIAPSLGRFTAIPLIIRLLLGTHLKRNDVLHVQCKKIRLKSDSPIPVIADGEIIDEACTDYSIEILEQQLNLLV